MSGTAVQNWMAMLERVSPYRGCQMVLNVTVYFIASCESEISVCLLLLFSEYNKVAPLVI
jgi:hypothetical protein